MNWSLLIDHLPALPEMVLLAGASALMLYDARSTDPQRAGTYLGAQLVLAACLAATGFVLWGSAGGRLVIFEGLFVADLMGHVLKIVSYGAVWAALVFSRRYLLDRGLLRGEFFTLLLFALLGNMVLISANSFLTVYLGLELMSLSLYALVALDRDSPLATEAAMKYFVLGALASGLLLYGLSMIYGATGVLTLNEVSLRLGALAGNASDQSFLAFGLVFVVAGIAFKLGVVPFHMWIPDVYHGAPTPVTLVIGSISKLAAFAMAMRLLVNGMFPLAQDWQQMLALLSLLSMAIGNITAIAQTNIKRMLAYSAIANMGFLLLGLLSGVVDGNQRNAVDAYSTAFFYAVTYVVMSVGAFGMVLLLARAGFEADSLDDFRGLNRRSPWYAFLMLLLMLSLAGLPPTVGFYAKLAVLQSAVAAGQVWLAVAAVVLSLVGAFYYLRVVKLMYFDDARDTQPIVAQLGFRILLSVTGLLVLLVGLAPQWVMAGCLRAIQSL